MKAQPNNCLEFLFQQCNYNLQLWAKFYGKIPSGKWFSIFGGKFYVVSFKSDFWQPFCYCKSDFWIFYSLLVLSDYFISGVNLSSKFTRKVLSWVRVHRDPLLTTNGSQKYFDHVSVKVLKWLTNVVLTSDLTGLLTMSPISCVS